MYKQINKTNKIIKQNNNYVIPPTEKKSK